MFKKTPYNLMPDNALGNGTLVEGNDENKPDALAVEEGDVGSTAIIDTDDIFASVDKGHDKLAQPSKTQPKDEPPKDDQPVDDIDPAQDIKDKEKSQDQVKDKQQADKQEDVKTEDKTQEQPKQDQIKKQRDYSKYAPEDVAVLKKLPNNIYNHVTGILDKLNTEKQQREQVAAELKKLKDDPNAIPDAWYEHEQAYTLSPEYQTAVSFHGRATYEANYWEQQLVQLKSKQPWSDLVYSVKEGQYYRGDEHPYDEARAAAEEIYLSRKLQQAVNFQGKYEGQIENIATNFKNYRGQIEKQYTDFSQPLIDKLRPDLKPKDEHIKDVLGSLHPSHRNSALGKLVGQMYSIIINQGQALLAAESKNNNQIKNQNDAIKAGAATKGIGATSPAGGGKRSNNEPVKEVDLEELENEMQG